ncbi:hypothetical protein AB0M39_15805 [Streptomyces sp. NPDC051907]|uniref:hypothetical protein n=1 Tax=Streptomyces sp. NPDC051907 TaxID=3155284 RepID=UPI003422FD4B
MRTPFATSSRLVRPLSLAGVVTALVLLTGCDGDGDGVKATGADGGTSQQAPSADTPPAQPWLTGDGDGRNGGASGGPEARQKMMLDNMPKAGTVMAAGEYVQRFTTCERYSIDPSDERYYPMDEKFDATWGVQFRGTCNDSGNGYIRVFKTNDMRMFQEAYRGEVAERMKNSSTADIEGGFAVGEDFAVIAPDDDSIRQLSASGLLILNCNPNFQPQGDVSTAPALVEGCVLTDQFVS